MSLTWKIYVPQGKKIGSIKGRGGYDSHKQWEYITKEETSPPTVIWEGQIMSRIINEME